MNPQPAAAVPIHGLHQFACRCSDAEETRRYGQDLLGLHIIQSDRVPSTGEYCPRTHNLLRETDGSCLKFFDRGDDLAREPSPNTPSWVNHLALRVDAVDDREQMRARLAEWTRREAGRGAQRPSGPAPAPLQPRQNERPEVAERGRRVAAGG